jgi:hypothetical protein
MTNDVIAAFNLMANLWLNMTRSICVRHDPTLNMGTTRFENVDQLRLFIDSIILHS